MARGGHIFTFDIWVVPGSSRCRVVGLHDGALKIQVSAPASEGQANAAALQLIADFLGVRLKSLSLEHGATSRRKRVAIACDSEQQAELLKEKLFGDVR